MNKRILAALLLSVMVFALAACGAQNAETGSVEPSPVATEAPLALLGEEAEGEYVYHLKITNATGQDITAFAVNADDPTAEEANMLPANEVFQAGETRALWYDAEADVNAAEADTAAGTPVTSPEYTITIALADGSTQTLHGFPFEDAAACEIQLDGDLAYLVYTSASTKETVSTHDAEQAARDLIAEQAAAAAAAEEAARQQAAAEEAARQQAAAAEAARQQAQQQQQYTQPDPDPVDTTDDGCVDDGLTWD